MGFTEKGPVDERAQVFPRLEFEARQAQQPPVEEQQGAGDARLDPPAGVDHQEGDRQINQGNALQNPHNAQVGQGKEPDVGVGGGGKEYGPPALLGHCGGAEGLKKPADDEPASGYQAQEKKDPGPDEDSLVKPGPALPLG